MKKFLVITIDVEPDCSSTWHYSNPLTFKGVTEGIAQRLQPLFNKYDIIPTYLINNVVLENKESVSILKNLTGRYELGTHLHPEFIEPEKKFDNYAGKKGTDNSCFYPPQIEFEKIKNITFLFEQQFDYKPTAFRAGRYSAGSNTIKSLVKLNYLVDTSVTPHICWNDATREQPVDFTDAPEQPYFIDAENIIHEINSSNILQVPISITLKERNPLKEFIISGAGLLHARRKYKPIWLRPYYSPFEDMLFLYHQYLSSYSTRDCIVFNMMFHNVEVLPGLSPYTNTDEDCERYLTELERFLIFCRKNEVINIGLSDLAHEFKK
ncbi:MAG TPA: hypothetical protein VFU29_02260 [Chitinophagaceae bacterium]|nr:hypothetical protein [Chitinophagaceae bacterium]